MPSAKRKIGIDYSELENLVKQLKQMDVNVKHVTEKALKKSQKHVTENLHEHMARHYRSGSTEKSIVENPSVVWIGNTCAEIDVGFDIANGGLPSIFLMYGTPRMRKDQKLYNALYGKKASEEIAEIQRDVFISEIVKLGG